MCKGGCPLLCDSNEPTSPPTSPHCLLLAVWTKAIWFSFRFWLLSCPLQPGAHLVLISALDLLAGNLATCPGNLTLTRFFHVWPQFHSLMMGLVLLTTSSFAVLSRLSSPEPGKRLDSLSFASLLFSVNLWARSECGSVNQNSSLDLSFCFVPDTEVVMCHIQLWGL